MHRHWSIAPRNDRA
ncbi:unnamed protein product [Diplocarpon coronariae]